MSMTDPIADLLTRIRNAQRIGHQVVASPSSRMRKQVLDVLQSEGYIRGYREKEVRQNVLALEVELKYNEAEPVIQEIRRVSKPGRRVYVAVDKIKSVKSGLGINILSTSRGVMSDTEARKQNLGGEVICQVF